jgi:outer membrane biosynthesis protein TonB
MSKKYLALIIVPALLMVLAVMALPGDATATQLLGITITPTPIVTEPPTPTPTDIVTEEPQPPSETPVPPEVTQPPPPATAKPKTTEVVLLPETGEFPIDPAQGIQWLFALTMIFLIGGIILRTLRTAKIKK